MQESITKICPWKHFNKVSKEVPCLTQRKLRSRTWIRTWVSSPVASFPRPSLLLPSVYVHNNTGERKTGEKRGRAGPLPSPLGPTSCPPDVTHVMNAPILRQLCIIVNANGGGLGTRLSLLNANQVLLPAEPLELWRWSRK